MRGGAGRGGGRLVIMQLAVWVSGVTTREQQLFHLVVTAGTEDTQKNSRRQGGGCRRCVWAASGAVGVAAAVRRANHTTSPPPPVISHQSSAPRLTSSTLACDCQRDGHGNGRLAACTATPAKECRYGAAERVCGVLHVPPPPGELRGPCRRRQRRRRRGALILSARLPSRVVLSEPERWRSPLVNVAGD